MKLNQVQKPGRYWLLVVMATFLVSCASVDSVTNQYIGVPQFPETDPAEIEILRTEPSQAHERLGEIIIDASTDPAPAAGKIEDELRRKAAKLGADAVIIVFDRVQPVGVQISGGWTYQTTSNIYGHLLIGLAIKYQ